MGNQTNIDADDKVYDCLKIENQLCFPLYACAKEMVRRYKPFLQELNLTYTQYITMMILWDEKKTNVKDLGKRLYLDSGTLTPLLKKLEQKGYIERRRSHLDERNLIVTLTESGEKLKQQAVKIPEKMGQCLNICKEDGQELYKLLHRLLETMQEN